MQKEIIRLERIAIKDCLIKKEKEIKELNQRLKAQEKLIFEFGAGLYNARSQDTINKLRTSNARLRKSCFMFGISFVIVVLCLLKEWL